MIILSLINNEKSPMITKKRDKDRNKKPHENHVALLIALRLLLRKGSIINR